MSTRVDPAEDRPKKSAPALSLGAVAAGEEDGEAMRRGPRAGAEKQEEKGMSDIFGSLGLSLSEIILLGVLLAATAAALYFALRRKDEGGD
jgi:hypothetical protein